MSPALNWGKYPILLVGATEDLSTWTKVGTWGTVAAAVSPFGDISNAYLLTPGASGTARYIESPDLALSATQDPNTMTVIWILKGGTTTSSVLSWRDTTAGATRRALQVTWSGGVPTIVNISGNTTLDFAINLGGSFWAIIFRVDAIVVANANKLRLFPAALSEADTTLGALTLTAYLRSAVICQWPLDRVKAYPKPREGSEFIKGSSGLEDSWIVGHDQFLDGTARWIPAVDEKSVQIGTGWEGASPLTTKAGVGTGWRKFLELARNKNTVRFIPDRTNAGANQRDGGWVDCYLVEPMNGDPDIERDGTRTLALKLRAINDGPIYGY